MTRNLLKIALFIISFSSITTVQVAFAKPNSSEKASVEVPSSLDLSAMQLEPWATVIRQEANLSEALYGKLKSNSSSSRGNSYARRGSSGNRVDRGASLGNRSGNVVATIDLSDQRMRVKINGAMRHDWPISSGRAGYSTPTGVFSPQRAYREYYSKKYDLAPMPSAVFFNGGIAVHGTFETARLGRPASHGCVRLSPSNAQTFLQLAKTYGRNIKIVVQR